MVVPMPEYRLNPTQSDRLFDGDRDGDDEICGEEMADGSKCQRDPETCRYHAEGDS